MDQKGSVTLSLYLIGLINVIWQQSGLYTQKGHVQD